MYGLTEYFQAIYEYDVAHEATTHGDTTILLVSAEPGEGIGPQIFDAPNHSMLGHIFASMSEADRLAITNCTGGVVITVTDTDVMYRMFASTELALDYYIDENYDLSHRERW